MKRRDDTLKRILGFVAPYRTAFILVLVFSVLSVAGTLYVPILTGDAIDFILGPGNVNFPRIVPILIQLLVTIAVGRACPIPAGPVHQSPFLRRGAGHPPARHGQAGGCAA